MPRRLFLERRRYRLNRLQDAARLLPILGLVLIFGPIFIRGTSTEAESLSVTLVYYFGIWFGLIVLTGLVSTALTRLGPQDGQGGPDAPDGPEAADPPTSGDG